MTRPSTTSPASLALAISLLLVAGASAGCSSLTDPTIQLTQEGVERLDVGDLATAEARFRAVLAEDAENPLALNNMGAIAEKRGDFASARSYYRLAMLTESEDTALVRDEEIPIVDLATMNLGRVERILGVLARRCAEDPTVDPSCAR